MVTGQQARQQVIDTATAILYQAIDVNEKEIVGLQQQLAEAQKKIAELEVKLAAAVPLPELGAAPTNFAASETAKPNGKGEK